jgi:hypothetical protein
MKTINVEEVVSSNPLVDREKFEEALDMIKKLAEKGVFPAEAHGGVRRKRGATLPDAGSQEHPKRIRSRHLRHR